MCLRAEAPPGQVDRLPGAPQERVPGRVTEATGAELCLCAARHPWEEGCVESASGPLRQCFPKGADFSAVADEEVPAVYDGLDRRPRGRLGRLTPWEARHSEALHLL